MKNKIIAFIAAVGVCLGMFGATASMASATTLPFNTWTTVNAGFTGRPCSIKINHTRSVSAFSVAENFQMARITGCQSFPYSTGLDTVWYVQINANLCQNASGICSFISNQTMLTTNTSDKTVHNGQQSVTYDNRYSHISSNLRVWRATGLGAGLAQMPPGSSSYWTLVGTYTT